MPTPVFYIKVNGADVTGRFRDYNMTMTVTDAEGLNADTLEIQLDDKDGRIKLPATGAIIEPTGGYEGNLRNFGKFEVDGITLSGWPQTLSISAKSVNAKSAAKQRKAEAYQESDYPTYGDIFAKVASDLSLTLSMSATLKAVANHYEAQSEESSLEFLTRLGEKIGAAVTIKAGRLVVVEKGKGKSASGQALSKLAVSPSTNLLTYSVNISEEPRHSSVEASTYDRGKNAAETVTAPTGLTGPVFVMRQPYDSKEAAERAAKAKASDLIRAQAEATFEIDGDPWAMAEAWVTASGIREGVDGDWRVKTASHTFSASAPYTTSLQCDYPSGGA